MTILQLRSMTIVDGLPVFQLEPDNVVSPFIEVVGFQVLADV